MAITSEPIDIIGFENVEKYDVTTFTVTYFNTKSVLKELGYVESEEELEDNESEKWDEINEVLTTAGYPSLTDAEKEDVIPENLVYMLAMHGTSKKAINFQVLIADEIVPRSKKSSFLLNIKKKQ